MKNFITVFKYNIRILFVKFSIPFLLQFFPIHYSKLKIIRSSKYSLLILRTFYCSFLCILSTNIYVHASELTLEEYVNNPFGNVIFLRHTLAPGFDAKGEPEKFNIDDCSTQRNLNSIGIEQAIKLGEKFDEYGIKFNIIYSSQWCRCLETARLLKLGEVIPESSLNSGFRGIFKKENSLVKLRELLSELKNRNGLFLMVTHYGTISAVTGIVVDSGGAVAYDPITKLSKEILLK